MNHRQRVCVLCGGQSAEHEISLISAEYIVQSLSQNQQFEVSLVYIDRQGGWHYLADARVFLTHQDDIQSWQKQTIPVTIVLGDHEFPLLGLDENRQKYPMGCVFPVLHGTLGEDGALQGLLEMMNLPYVGANVLSSALCMEKHMSKQILRAAGIPTTDWVTLNSRQYSPDSYRQISDYLGAVLFVKPAALGSSVGISKVCDQQTFDQAIQLAFLFDDHVIVERAVNGCREFECAVLGNELPKASLPGELVINKQHQFYSYEAKYLDSKGSVSHVPAECSQNISKKIQELAVKAYEALQCTGMARVDFFVTDDAILVNELNTIPGFTPISLYPKCWEVSGKPAPQLMNELIQLAIEKHQRGQSLSRHRQTPDAHDETPKTVSL